jgi:hypothetical protein
VLLLLAVVLGVVVMHSPVAGPATPAATDPMPAGPMSLEPMAVTPSAVAPMPLGHGPPGAVLTPGTGLASAVDAHLPSTQDGSAGDHDSMPAGALHELMHLCLAVLAGLVVLGLVVLVFLLRRAARSAAALLPAPVVVPPRPPPRTAVRLAQLCVLRN